MRARLLAKCLVVAELLSACQDSIQPRTGALRVSVVTTGGDLDLNGYVASADSGAPLRVATNGSSVIADLPTGSHDVALTDVAQNCTLSGDNPRAARVSGGDTADVDFEISCVATGVRVTTMTTGLDVDPDGYAVSIDGMLAAVLGLNDTTEVTRLAVGSHTVVLTARAPNCPVAGDTVRTVNLALGQIEPVVFNLNCTAVTGNIEVTTATSGIDLDVNGYTVQVDGGTARAIPATGVLRFTGLDAGTHDVTLGGAAANCTIAGDNPRALAVITGGATRHTAQTTFVVTCVAVSGVIEVTAATSGIDLDADAYMVRVDTGPLQPLGSNGTARFSGLVGGDHTVTLSGVTGNCTTDGENPRTVAVTVGGTTRDTARTTFAVTCGAASGLIEVTAATSGVELDPDGYVVRVDSGPPQALGINGTARFGGLNGGAHSVTLSGAAGNCTIDGENPRTVPVTVGGATRDTARTTFVVTCVASTGTLKITTTTTGAEIDPNGYVVVGDEYCYYSYGNYCYYSFSEPVPSTGAVTIAALSTGQHTVQLNDVAPNCVVAGQNYQTVSIPPGDTLELAYTVTCYARGALRIAVTTTGADPDTNGYVFVVRGPLPSFGDVASSVLASNDTITVPGLVAGNYQVDLVGVAANCTVAGGATRAVAVPWADTADVAFAVSCAALGSLEVTVATTGTGLDPDGYTIVANSPAVSVSRHVAINGTVTIGALAPGDYQLTLTGVAFNCSVSGTYPSPITVPSGATATATFNVACVAPGSIEVTTSTTGLDLDPNGYAATTTAGPGASVPTNGTVTISGIRAGDYQLSLGGVSMNCDVSGANPRTLSVPSGGTVAVTFDVSCATAPVLAIVTNGVINSIKSNGAGLLALTGNTAVNVHPSWSPGGARIAFTSFRDGAAQVYVMDANGANQTRLTAVGANERPTWSPDGSKMAFVSWRSGDAEIFVMNADGTNQVNITHNAATELDPAWSPDGTKIAFVSLRSGTFQLHVMGVDGSNVTRLTVSNQNEYQPDWSPDGTRLAISRETSCDYYYGYYCVYETFLVNANAAGETPLSAGFAADPVWSPDGQWIAFSTDNNSVWAVRVDGTRAAEVSSNASQPAWRRP